MQAHCGGSQGFSENHSQHSDSNSYKNNPMLTPIDTCSWSSSPTANEPLTPEESPRSCHPKRRADDAFEPTPIPAGQGSVSPTQHTQRGDQASHACICPQEPRIPRPRNAFILYRQHNQARIVRDNPGVPNPNISKIIGHQWKSESLEVQAQWKELAEEEKLSHQRRHPNYRYQPRRNNLKYNAVLDSAYRCRKCGRRTFMSPVSPRVVPQLPRPLRSYSSVSSDHLLHARTGDAPSLQAPHVLKTSLDSQNVFSGKGMSNRPRDQGVFLPCTSLSLRDASATSSLRDQPLSRVSFHLPDLRTPMCMRSPGSTPSVLLQPIINLQETGNAHSHEHGFDQSLTLPPLRFDRPLPPSPRLGVAGDDQEIYDKHKFLQQIAPPGPSHFGTPRGPLIAIESDDTDAATGIATWLAGELSKLQGLSVRMLDGPCMQMTGGKANIMARYHRLAAEWLERSDEILESLAITPARGEIDHHVESRGSPSDLWNRGQQSSDTFVRHRTGVDLKDESIVTRDAVLPAHLRGMEMPLCVVANYSLSATNFFSTNIPLTKIDHDSSLDHWQWIAMQWRGIVGPDLTVHVQRTEKTAACSFRVEFPDDASLLLLTYTSSYVGIRGIGADAQLLSRLASEVHKWVQAFAARQ